MAHISHVTDLSTEKIPVIIALGDFASGVVSWAFRLRDAMAANPRYRVILVNCHKTGNKIGRFDAQATKISEISALLHEFGRGIVIPNFVWDIFDVCAPLMAAQKSFKTIGYCRADSDEEYYAPLSWYAPVITRFAAVSPECAATLKQRLPERSGHVYTMPTGVLVPNTLARSWKKRPIRLVYGGRIVQEQKRVLDLVPLVKHLRDRSVPFTLTVAGIGRQLDELKAGINASGASEYVRFTGRLAPEKMSRLWAEHDIFVQTSAYEGTSNSMLEAMAQGTVPVVTDTQSGVHGILEHGHNGLLVEVGDMAAMADAIAQIVASGNLETMGRAAHVAARPYSIECYAKKFTAMLDDAWQDEVCCIPSGFETRPKRVFEGINLHNDTSALPDANAERHSPSRKLMITFPSHLRGGAEEYTLTIARGAVASGWEVLAAFTRRKHTETLRQDFKRLGAVYHALETCELGDKTKQASFRKRITRTLRFLVRHKPDVLLLELPGIQYGLGTMIAAALAGIPVISVYQLVRDDIRMPWRNRLAYPLLRLRNQHYVAVSDYSRDILAAKSGLRKNAITVIPNGADLSRFQMEEATRRQARLQVRQELGYEEDTLLLLTVGRLASQKGHDLLVPVIPHIVKVFPQARFLWVGDGPLQHKLTELLRQYDVEPFVRFLGHRDDIPALLAASDLFVHPTRFEGLPFSVVEAMAAGTPVVSTRASSIPELIHHGETGLLCDLEDIYALRETVLYALNHLDKIREMASHARDRAALYSAEAMTAKTLDLLVRTIGKPHEK